MNELVGFLLWTVLAVSVQNHGLDTIENPTLGIGEPLTMNDQDQDAPILSKDYQTAKAALLKAVSEKDTSMLRIGLNTRLIHFKLEVLEAISKVGDRSMVPNVVKALEENQSFVSGGSEMQFAQRDINKAAFSALRKFTELPFEYVTEESLSKRSSKQIQRLIKEAKDWSKTHLKKG